VTRDRDIQVAVLAEGQNRRVIGLVIPEPVEMLVFDQNLTSEGGEFWMNL
jgi:hypothetical protein